MSEEFISDLTKWLVSRQTLMVQEEDELSMAATAEDEHDSAKPIVFPPTFHVLGAFPVSLKPKQASSIEVPPHELQWAGFNGRCNKVADTCYAFWVGGTLGVSF